MRTMLWLTIVLCLVGSLAHVGQTSPLGKDVTEDREEMTIEEYVANGGKPWEYKNDQLPPPPHMQKRSGNPNTAQDWPFGQVPYVFDHTYNAADRRNLQRAFDYYHQHTCVRWIPRTNQKDYVVIKKPADGTCNSHIGRLGIGPQDLNIAQWCLDNGRGNEPGGGALHEMMHCLGFHHEQQRPDRDSYIWIYWDNIDPKFGPWFDIYKGSLTYGTRYDYRSVMHYTTTAGSKNRKATMIPKDGTDPKVLGNRGGSLSSTDIYRIKAHYNCDGQWTRARYNKEANCKDDNSYCQYWARLNPSNCDHADRQGYMMDHCPSQCQVCGPSLGCYDSLPYGVMTYVKGAFLSQRSCKRNCFMAGYKYAGLKGGNSCLCSVSNLGRKVSSNLCRGVKCPGNPNQYCGSSRYTEVFYA